MARDPVPAANLIEGILLTVSRGIDDALAAGRQPDFARADADLQRALTIFNQNLLGTKHPLEEPTWRSYLMRRDYVAKMKRDAKAREFAGQRGQRVVWKANEWDNAGNWGDVVRDAARRTGADLQRAGETVASRGYNDVLKLAALAVVLYVGIPAVMRGLRK